MTSKIKTLLFLAALSAIIILIGGAIGGKTGILFAFVLALIMNVGSYWYSDKIVLSLYGAKELSRGDAPALYKMVEELAAKANIPMPRVCIINENAPNAFATGRNPEHGVVAVTSGLMQLLTPEEVKGVLAHEIGHIKNRDILIQTIAAVMATVILSLASFLRFAAIFGGGNRDSENEGGNPLAAIALAIIAPIAATLIQLAISRSREYLADDTGAQLAGNPLYLANALGKLDTYSKQLPPMHATQATAHMFIINPLVGNLRSLFSTHPPIQERIQRLQEQARTHFGQQ